MNEYGLTSRQKYFLLCRSLCGRWVDTWFRHYSGTVQYDMITKICWNESERAGIVIKNGMPFKKFEGAARDVKHRLSR